MKIIPCVCQHAYQDRTYGPQQRAMNATKSIPPQYRCTVCGRIH